MDLVNEQKRTASRQIAAQKKKKSKKASQVASQDVISAQPMLNKANDGLDDIFNTPSPRPQDAVFNDDDNCDDDVNLSEIVNQYLEEQRYESESRRVCVESDYASVG